MGFVPLTGPAELAETAPGVRPGEAVVAFTAADGGRRVELPVRAALPVLTKAHAREDVHPSVGLLAGAALLALRLVAAGRLVPDAVGDGWRIAPLPADDDDRVARLALARSHEGLPPDQAEAVVRRVLDAVADTMPRTASRPPRARPAASAVAPGDFAERLAARLDRLRAPATPGQADRATPSRLAEDDDRPQLVRLALRVEADEEDLSAGSVRLVLQVHDEQDPLHLCDATDLWADPDGPSHGFGGRARTHASIALRAAAEAWPVLDRMLDGPAPDDLTLDGDDLASLLEDGVAALGARGVDVLWPRSLGRDLTATSVLDRVDPRHPQDRGPATGPGPHEEPLQDPLLGPDSVFAFRWQLALHGEDLTAAEMDALADAASPLLKLRGGWTVVDPATARKARKRLQRTVAPTRAIAAALTGTVPVEPGTGLPPDTPVVVGASLLRVREQLVGAATTEPVPPPAGLHAELRDYQRHGLTWLATLTGLGLGGCLADDMGLGKTVTLVALHLHRTSRGATGPTLVVCPASLLGNWEAEIRRFAPGVRVRRFHGGERTHEDLAPDATGATGPGASTRGFVLTTYGTMRRDAERLGTTAWDLVVADEAQHVKNARSSTARALRTIDSAARVALTGTPVENDLTELWAILDWTVPGLLGSRNAFRKVWAAPIESGLEPTKARQFADLIGPFLLRRRKSDPGIAPELPAKTETDHLLRLTREQVVLYEAFCRDTLARIERADEDARRGLVLALLTGCKQICNHPAQFLKQSGGRLRGRSEKLDLLEELLTTVVAEGGAVLVFTQYVAMARLVEQHLAAVGVPHQLLHGGTPVPQREAMVAAFQAGEVPVFLLSLKAGGTGLNLVRADHVVHLDRWWNPAVEDQATDRAYRIGQTRPVQVHRLVAQGTIEERIGQLLARKRSLADAVLGRGEAALTELSDAELHDLVRLRQPDVS
ncbi:DEAD/DEAH box helicase [Nocardioides sp. AX2bis]|uniref:DEAD/DEAH box helicase n=1 Tax=Nocardioides sp. AX2bis TaxID=2653157 RepID=UPI0012F1D19D|nr:DEAD/DEAH box helicase [Nocardioides sp. AX2bis]VXC39438.1 ATP-dependent helicase [Nocardioides sp. AX2bis]